MAYTHTPIPPISYELKSQLQHLLDNKAKPVGSLGQLEDIAIRLGMIQGSLRPLADKACILTVAADHGVTEEGVSPCPEEITWQQVLNFLDGGGGIGLFCSLHGLDLYVADAGVKYNFAPRPNLIDAKIA
jgi:nicotinate-nucleotide--dimethylbenzimidazole phosphoribosyltransferase